MHRLILLIVSLSFSFYVCMASVEDFFFSSLDIFSEILMIKYLQISKSKMKEKISELRHQRARNLFLIIRNKEKCTCNLLILYSHGIFFTPFSKNKILLKNESREE